MTTANAIYDPKRPDAIELFGWDFKMALASNEAIASAVVTSEFVSGSPDANLNSMIVNAAQIYGTKVTQLIGGGINGNTYNLRFTIVTTMGQRIEAVGQMFVSD